MHVDVVDMHVHMYVDTCMCMHMCMLVEVAQDQRQESFLIVLHLIY